MRKKEVGTVHTTKCTACKDELAVGWVGGREIHADNPRVLTVAVADHQGVGAGPISCGCGGTRLRLHEATPRAVLEWTTPEEPVMGSLVIHGNPRDLVR